MKTAEKAHIYFFNGVSYEGFRPKYPQELIDTTLKKVKNFNNFLDVATGTG